jgi:hypothetical protein
LAYEGEIAMPARLGLILAFLAALICAPLALALTPAQEQALRAELAAQARQDPETGARVAFARADLAGAFIFGDPATENGMTCRPAIIELAQPERNALQTEVCRKAAAFESFGKPQWRATAPLTPAHAAGGGAPPPSSPPPMIEAEKAPPPPVLAAPARPATRGPAATPGGRPRSSGAAAPDETGGGLDRVISPVLVELGPTEARFARHGGSGLVLLSENAADGPRNLSLCRALFKSFDTATNAEIEAGERQRDDQLELLRPLYWPLKDTSRPALGADKCVHRIGHYDFARAWRVRSKLGLTGRGPYLLVIRADETRAGLVDFAGVADKDIPDLVRYFRDGFSQETDIWSPQRHGPEAEGAALTAFLGRPLPLAALPRLVIVSVARAGCPLGDLFDVCGNPLPRP